MRIALLTPTGNRPEQIKLCAEFMKHQDYEGEVLWIIIDDGNISTTTDITREGWGVIKIYPEPKWRKGQNTQSRNLLAGIEELKKHKVDIVFIIEDDDYYSPRYLRVMVEKLNDYDIAGEMESIYYNPVLRIFKRMVNMNHSSLFQVAFTINMLSLFENICRIHPYFIDIIFFRVAKGKVNIFSDGNMAIGIKGMAGRKGIGVGHRMKGGIADPELKTLKKLIGEDYKYYESANIHNRG